VPENTLPSNVVYQGSAVDSDRRGILSYALTGEDSFSFNVDPQTGAVRFKASPDYELPADGNLDNTYNIIFHASDGVHDTTQAVTIAVTDVSEAPRPPPPGSVDFHTEWDLFTQPNAVMRGANIVAIYNDSDPAHLYPASVPQEMFDALHAAGARDSAVHAEAGIAEGPCDRAAHVQAARVLPAHPVQHAAVGVERQQAHGIQSLRRRGTVGGCDGGLAGLLGGSGADQA